MKNNDNDAPEQMEGFNARLRGIESIIKQAMQKNTNLTLNFFLSSVGQHVERTDSAHVWMKKDDDMETQTFGSKGDAGGGLTKRQIITALLACRDEGLIWANSAYSIAFCVCRDDYMIENNATSFERLLAEGGIVLPEGTINNCLSRHPWMRYPVDKWEEKGAKGRALVLRNAFRQQMELQLFPAKMTA